MTKTYTLTVLSGSHGQIYAVIHFPYHPFPHIIPCMSACDICMKTERLRTKVFQDFRRIDIFLKKHIILLKSVIHTSLYAKVSFDKFSETLSVNLFISKMSYRTFELVKKISYAYSHRTGASHHPHLISPAPQTSKAVPVCVIVYV